MAGEFDVETADKAALEAYAKDILNLEVKKGATEDDLRKLISEALGDVSEQTATVVIAEKDWPVININTDGKDKRDVQVNVNGRQYLIQRAKDVAVPPAVLEVLKNAVQTVYPDTKTMEPVNQYTYPFTIVKQAGK